MTYLFNSKEPGVLEYIGNKLFTFSNDEVFQLKSVCITFSTLISLQVDFYLPQLINMYIMLHAVAEVIHPYLIARLELQTATSQYFPNVSEDNYYPLLFMHFQFWWQFPIFRCRQSVQFSLQCAWLLQSYSGDANLGTKKKSQGESCQ